MTNIMNISTGIRKRDFQIFTLLALIILQTFLSEHCLAAEPSKTGEVIEYCEGQTFSARCESDDEVVMMTSALYGRMRRGKCINVHADLGCERNILPHFDSWCSGRRHCEVRVSSIYDTLRDEVLTCTKDFRGYLEASYICVKVVNRKTNCTREAARIDVSEMRSGHLASVVTEETTCGTNIHPWLIEALPGQTIQFTLLDFNVVNKIPYTHGVCQVHAVIRELKNLAHDTICRSDTRESVVYTSVSHRLDVRMLPSSQKSGERNQNLAFMFRYQVLGCSDLVPPGVQWLRRSDPLTAHVGCNGTGDHWMIKCNGNEWVGERPNCTHLGMPVWSAGTLSEQNSFWIVFTGPQWAAIAVVLAIAVSIGLIIFLIGLIYIRRKRARLQRTHSRGGASLHCSLSDYHMSQCQAGGMMTSAYNPGGQHPPYIPTSSKILHSTDGLDYPPNVGVGENDYFRTWQLQRHNGREAPQFYHRQYHSGPPIDSPTSQCPGDGSCRGMGRPIMEHIYESPKFERRDPQGMRGEGCPGGFGSPEVECGVPGLYTSTKQTVNPLQYYELKSRDGNTSQSQLV